MQFAAFLLFIGFTYYLVHCAEGVMVRNLISILIFSERTICWPGVKCGFADLRMCGFLIGKMRMLLRMKIRILPSLFFGRTVCKTVRPMLSDLWLSVCLTLVYCGQMVGWTKMKLGPGNVV